MLAGSAVVLLVTLVLYGGPVPRLSEELYLPLVRHAGDPAYLAGDWTIRGPFTEHWVFNHVFGWLAAALPLRVFAWLGRIVAWSFLSWNLVRLGRRLGAGAGAATGGICLWLLANQAFVGSEWMLGTFEAKTVAYCFLVAALLAATRQRVALAMVLLGATVSLHPGVGLWAGLGLGLTLCALAETRRAALRWAPVGALVALPGVIGALAAADFRSADLTRFLVIEALPHHADPLFGGARLPGLQVLLHVTALVAMFAANWWWARRATPSSAFAHRVILGVQVVTMIAVGLAFVARAAHWWSFLLLSPLRVGPLMVALVFFLNLAREVAGPRRPDANRARRARRTFGLALAGAAIALAVSAPVFAAPRMVERTFAAWVHPDDEVAAFEWINAETPRSTRCLVPVDRQDAFMLGARPVVANWQAIRYDDLEEWHRRVAQLVGGDRYFTDPNAPGRIPGRRGGDLESLRGAYDALGQHQIEAIAHRYRADCIVATTRYRIPVWHRVGRVRVYRFTDPDAVPPAPDAVTGG